MMLTVSFRVWAIWSRPVPPARTSTTFARSLRPRRRHHLAGDRKAFQLVGRKRECRVQLERLLVILVGSARVVQFFLGQAAIVIGEMHLIEAKRDGFVEIY